MGYFITTHVMRAAPDVARLQALPRDIAWDLYRDQDAPAWYLDVFKINGKQHQPFASTTLLTRPPLELQDDLSSLSKVYAALLNARLANGFRRGFVNANLLISQLLGQRVCSVYCDDDTLDFACVSSDGQLQRLRCECGDLEIVYDGERVTIQPLEREDDDENLTDLSALHDPDGGITVMGRNKEQSTLLHSVAGSELATFLELPAAPLGVGSFDGIRKMPLKIASSDR